MRQSSSDKNYANGNLSQKNSLKEDMKQSSIVKNQPEKKVSMNDRTNPKLGSFQGIMEKSSSGNRNEVRRSIKQLSLKEDLFMSSSDTTDEARDEITSDNAIPELSSVHVVPEVSSSGAGYTIRHSIKKLSVKELLSSSSDTAGIEREGTISSIQENMDKSSSSINKVASSDPMFTSSNRKSSTEDGNMKHSSIKSSGKTSSQTKINEEIAAQDKQQKIINNKVIPWVPNTSKSTRYQMKAAFKENLIEHMHSINPDSEITSFPLTKVIFCIAPDTSIDVIQELIMSGMTTVLLPMTMFRGREKYEAVERIRQAVKNIKMERGVVYPLGIGIDVKGDEIYTGRLHVKGVDLPLNSILRLTVDPIWQNCGTATKVFIHLPYREIFNHIKPGLKMHIDTRISVEVLETDGEDIVCRVTRAGKLYDNRNVKVLELQLFVKDLTQGDLKDIDFAIEMHLDFIYIQAIRSESTIDQVRKILDYRKTDLLLVAKIESSLAAQNMEHIVAKSDAVSICRKCLADEVAEERVILFQDKFIATCKLFGKPVFIEGLLLRPHAKHHQAHCEPLINTLEVVNSCQKGIDGVLMRNAFVYGINCKHLLEQFLRVCSIAEPTYWHSHFFAKMSRSVAPPMDPVHALAIAAVQTAMKSGAVSILVCTTSGQSAKLVCRYSPRVPVIAITKCPRIARQLTIFKAAIPYVFYPARSIDDFQREVDIQFNAGINLGKQIGIIRPGDPVVLLSGSRPGPGGTNMMRIVYASFVDDPESRGHAKGLRAIIPSYSEESLLEDAVCPNSQQSIQHKCRYSSLVCIT